MSAIRRLCCCGITGHHAAALLSFEHVLGHQIPSPHFRAGKDSRKPSKGCARLEYCCLQIPAGRFFQHVVRQHLTQSSQAMLMTLPHKDAGALAAQSSEL
jgi:hypothetical protein